MLTVKLIALALLGGASAADRTLYHRHLVARQDPAANATATGAANSTTTGATGGNATAPMGGNATCSMNWNGTAITGIDDGGACRYTVRYGQAERWEYSVPPTNHSDVDASKWPPMCPQTDYLESVLGSTPMNYSEDCLYMTVFAPTNVTNSSALPVFFWIHGGSYIGGSVSDKGLNGSALATKDNIIVVFIQYRLGILGFLPPSQAPTSSDPNFALRDAILALNTVHDNIGAVGGDSAKVTVGGQSAGASLIRALWGAPSARGLFRGLIMHSDPMIFGTQSPSDEKKLQDFIFTNTTNFGNCSDIACFKNVTVDKILAAQALAVSKVPANITTVPLGETFRPQFGTVTLPQDPANALFYNTTNLGINVTEIPIMMTTMRNESGYLVDEALPNAVAGSPELYQYALNQFLHNTSEVNAVINSGFYGSQNGSDGLRTSLEHFITDAVWRCATRPIASQFAAKGAKIWLGEWTEGIVYTFNQQGYCLTPGVVCHGNDVYPTFQSSDNVTDDQAALENVVHNYWSSFIIHGDPTAGGQNWTQWTANSTVADVNNIGNKFPISDCPANFFGSPLVPWKWQTDSNETVTTLGTGPSPSSPSTTDKGTGKNSVGRAVAPIAAAVLAAVAGAAIVL